MKLMHLMTAALAASLAGCASISIPITGTGQSGEEWVGYFTTSEFQLSTGNVICSGKPSMGFGKVNQHSFSCDDGRTGVATTTRTSMSGGIGSVEFSDGSSAILKYGQ